MVFLPGGIIGAVHHLYFSRTPNIVLALGATFSALEAVPPVLIGFEAWENIRFVRSKDSGTFWVAAYKWPTTSWPLASRTSLAPGCSDS